MEWMGAADGGKGMGMLVNGERRKRRVQFSSGVKPGDCFVISRVLRGVFCDDLMPSSILRDKNGCDFPEPPN